MKRDAISNASITTDMFNYSFNPDTSTKLQLFHDIGFRYIHWCDDWREELLYSKEQMRALRDLIDSSGLKCIDVHSAETRSVHICSEDQEHLERYIRLLQNRIEFCRAVGGDAVVVHPPDGEKSSHPPTRRLERSLAVFDALRPLCEKNRIVLAVENCHQSDEKALQYYFEKYPPEFVGFCFDSGHANVDKNHDKLLRFADRMTALHLHDNKGMKDDHQPPFWGTIDWSSLMRSIARTGYSKPFNFEITHRPGLFEGSMEEYLEFAVRSIRQTMALVDGIS